MAPFRLIGLLLFVCCTGTAIGQDTAPLERTGGRVKIEDCAKCHQREFGRLRDGSHAGILAVAELPGCETCHGPGAAHATAAGNDPRLITLPAALAHEGQVALCGRCHQQQIERHGGDPAGFRAAGLLCTDCHSVHGKREEPVLPGQTFDRREALAAHARAVGTARCIDCHPLRDESLLRSPHASLAAATHSGGCELCHGEGSLHEQTGAGRLITRPDRAGDGIATCRSCHEHVDAREFHWVGKTKPYLSEHATCTTCHVVHTPPPPAAPPVPGDDPHGEPAAAPATNMLCANCHAAAFATMPGSSHASVGVLAKNLAEGCGSCHRGSLAHAQQGGRRELLVPWRADADAQARSCLQCHDDEESLAHVRGGVHHRNGVGCVDCHGPLHGQTHQDAAEHAEQQCARCHADVQAQFRLPNHHPVPEGRMRCASCHDVHGGRARVRDPWLQEGSCVQCHVRYRGPFVFAHQAGRRDGCVVCHVPHGSSNRRLLQQADTQQNCLQCHGDFPAFHDQTPGAVFTNCIRCHTEVHGSNHSRYLFR